MLHQTLWQANLELAQACLKHPFVQGLASGGLALAAFRRYVAQDAFFLRAFLRAYALAAAKCEKLDTLRRLHEFMGGALEELALHGRYAERLGIDLNQVQPLPATRAYTDFLLHTAWQADIAEILAAMTPCMRLYAWLGQTLVSYQRPGHPYGDWLETYAGAEFETLASAIETLLDETATDNTAIQAAYRYAMQCELAFFGAPLHEQPPPV